ncbi:MAG: hypothetical protein ABIP68_02755 [Ferruginibacter sp.]
MNLQTVKTDITKMEQALRLIEQTENYLHFNKSNLIFDICEQINVLKDKRDKQLDFLNTLSQN